jgi:hypothetical protein
VGLGTAATQATGTSGATLPFANGTKHLGRDADFLAAATRAIVASGYSLTGSNAQSLLELRRYLEHTGAPTGIKLSITNTASNGASWWTCWSVAPPSSTWMRQGG